ncbi:hypothetical protein [Natrinema sp. H-ect4]|uniref:hypothetical protein n=1 Tax=Natrinema sp. H-ect4 TaxID=3242699 RepID=UPI0035A935F0
MSCNLFRDETDTGPFNDGTGAIEGDGAFTDRWAATVPASDRSLVGGAMALGGGWLVARGQSVRTRKRRPRVNARYRRDETAAACSA